MGQIAKLPIGIENFQELRTEGFYYVDKTGLIRDLLNHWGKVNLFTRPRRFGKSLNMSMLKYFFSHGTDNKLFDGLEISAEKELCEKYMGKFPVISITLKGISSRTFEKAQSMLCSVIGREALQFQFLLESKQLSGQEKKQYAQLIHVGGQGEQGFIMDPQVLENSLLTLTRCLHKHYGQKAILLIDEYDVPLEKAQQFDYYNDMVSLVRNLLGQALKSNDSLYFSVLTGCLQIAKESIFTGLNNFKTFSVTDIRYDEHFGFTTENVKELLAHFGFNEKFESIREWYDGYRFGNMDIYCPWDVINYVDLLCTDPCAAPKAFWVNTSSNDIIRNFLKMAKQSTKREIEQLIEGEYVAKKINQNLTYRDLHKNINNLWSVLFTTGYLTQRGNVGDDIYQLAIPNLEIRKIFVDQILEWFQEETRKNIPQLDAFCQAFAKGDAETIEKQLCSYLQKTISIRDTGVPKAKKENFYHGILLGLLSHREEWDLSSNAESGDGYSDILIEIPDQNTGIVVEVKYSESDQMETACLEALKQIEDKSYDARLIEDGMEHIIRYGIACRKKKCRVQALGPLPAG